MACPHSLWLATQPNACCRCDIKKKISASSISYKFTVLFVATFAAMADLNHARREPIVFLDGRRLRPRRDVSLRCGGLHEALREIDS
jgi:hypothetical protein